jgi:hypothetical protein
MADYAATYKRVASWGGGWAATLKSAMQQGKPVCRSDPRYLNRFLYVFNILEVMGFDQPYHDAIRARCRQMGC